MILWHQYFPLFIKNILHVCVLEGGALGRDEVIIIIIIIIDVRRRGGGGVNSVIFFLIL